MPSLPLRHPSGLKASKFLTCPLLLCYSFQPAAHSKKKHLGQKSWGKKKRKKQVFTIKKL